MNLFDGRLNRYSVEPKAYEVRAEVGGEVKVLARYKYWENAQGYAKKVGLKLWERPWLAPKVVPVY